MYQPDPAFEGGCSSSSPSFAAAPLPGCRERSKSPRLFGRDGAVDDDPSCRAGNKSPRLFRRDEEINNGPPCPSSGSRSVTPPRLFCRNPTFVLDAGEARGSPPLLTPLKREASFVMDAQDAGYRARRYADAGLLDAEDVGYGVAPQLAEIVLDCMKADGIDLAMLPPAEKSIAFRVDSNTQSLKALIGREHQAEFFDRLVPRKEFLACISRAHFELRLDSGATSPILRKLSRNPLHVNNLHVGGEDTVLADKSLLGFKGIFEAEPCFLILCVTFRGRSALEHEGPHPSLTPKAQDRRPPTLSLQAASLAEDVPQQIGAVLECVHSAGADISALQPNMKVIPLPLDTPLDVGRHCQFEVFGQLLQASQQLLALISRRHCTVKLSNGDAPSPGSVAGASKVAEELGSSSARGRATWLLVENLSTNVVSVDGHLLGRGKSRVMAEGATVAFVRPADGNGRDNFLEFRLRRARMASCPSPRSVRAM